MKSKTSEKVKSFKTYKSNTNKNFAKEYLKASILEIALLNKSTKLLDKLTEAENKNAKELTKSISKFFNGEKLETKETNQLSSRMTDFLHDIKIENSNTNTKLDELNLKMLKLLNNTSDAEVNEKILISSLGRIDDQLESNKISSEELNRTLSVYLSKRKNGRLEDDDSSQNKKSSFFSEITKNLGTKVLGSAGAILGTMLGLGTTGVGALVGGKIAGKVFGLKNKLSSNKVPRVSTDSVDDAAKIGSKSKGLSKVLKGAKKFLGPVGLALTVYDVLTNAKEEFFGKDSDKKSMYEKIRNTFTKTLSDFFFGIVDSETLNKGIDTVLGALKSPAEMIGQQIGKFAGWVYDALKGMLPKSISDLLPDFNTSNSSKSNSSKAVKNDVTSSSLSINQRATEDATYNIFKNPFKAAKKSARYWMGDKNWDSESTPMSEAEDAANFSREPSNKSKSLSFKAMNFNVVNKLGVRKGFRAKDNVNGSIGGFGSCYANSARVIAQFDPDLDVTKTGDTTSAYQFNHFYDKYGKAKLNKIQPNSSLPKSGLLPGDIVVYNKNYIPGHADGHIEIIGPNGDAHSDYTDPNAAMAQRFIKDKKYKDGTISVYRLKDAEKRLDNITNKKATTTETKSANSSSMKIEKSDKITTSSKVEEFKTKAYKAIEMNESDKPTEMTRDPQKGYNFGKAQFNSFGNPDSWKRINFNETEINKINNRDFSGTVSKEAISKRLLDNAAEIAKMDEEHKTALYNKMLEQKKSLFESQGIKIDDPMIQAQIMDINNQFGGNTLGKDSARYMRDNSKSKDKVDIHGIEWWKLNRTDQGDTESRKKDAKRRINNVQKVFADSSVKVGEMKSPQMKANSEIKTVKIRQQLSSNNLVKPMTETKQTEAPQVNIVQQQSQQAPEPNREKIRNIGNDDLLFINFGNLR